MRNWEFASAKSAEATYVFSAKSAPFTLAWGIAPGIRTTANPSAESAIHSGTISLRCVESRLQRSFMVRSETWGDAPGYRESAPLALDRCEPTVMPESTFGNQRPSGSDHSTIP
jgi:hypothetical protein